MSSPGPDFQLMEAAEGARHRLALTGELDLVSAGQLEAAVAGLCERQVEEIVLDLSGLAFVDSTGLRAILSCWELAEGRCRFSLIPGPRAVQRLFEVTGLLARLPFVDAAGTSGPAREAGEPAEASRLHAQDPSARESLGDLDE